MQAKQAIQAINKKGILLVYPVPGKSDPSSLWSEAYPRSKMRWEWDANGDDRVSELWFLREELSKSRKVIYSKWLQGRATFFSRKVFCALLALFSSAKTPLSRDAKKILALLEESSPRSTREIKRGTELQGRLLESTYHRSMKELWDRLAIVAFGEVDEGSFPSLAVGATNLLFEDLYLESSRLDRAAAEKILTPYFPSGSAASRQLKASLSRAGLEPMQNP